MEQAKRCLRNITLIPIYLYRWGIRPCLPSCCRYYPSCSDYAIQAIHTFGCIKGILLIVKRLVRCHPWSPGGYDPIKSVKEKY